jgi:hypothetical protein
MGRRINRSMKALHKLILIVFVGTLMLSSCSVTPSTSSLKEGHAYIYNEKRLYDLDELKYVDPGFEVDVLPKTDEEIYEIVTNDSDRFIITFTVIEYTTQTEIKEPDKLDAVKCTLSTRAKVDVIHYIGEDVQLKEGDTYKFTHSGAWVLERDGKMVYTIHPTELRDYAMFKYGCQYVMCGWYDEDTDTYYVNNYLGYNENVKPENIWFLK